MQVDFKTNKKKKKSWYLLSKIHVIQQILRNTKCLALCPSLENQRNYALIGIQKTFPLYI